MDKYACVTSPTLVLFFDHLSVLVGKSNSALGVRETYVRAREIDERTTLIGGAFYGCLPGRLVCDRS